MVAVVRALLLSLLFAQIALAASGCLMPTGEVAKIVSETQDAACDEPAMNTSLCLAHCTADLQSADHYSVALPEVTLALLPFIVVPLAQQNYVATSAQTTVPRALPSPVPILFCSLLI
jgi:hypothetical protein